MENIEVDITELVQDKDYKDKLEKYFDIVYIDGDYDIRPKPGVTVTGMPTVSPISPVHRPSSMKMRSLKKLGFGFGNIKDSLIEAEREQRFKDYLQHKQKRIGSKRIIVEGDSWGQNPLVKDIVDHLQKDKRFSVLSFARAGDELIDMTTVKEYQKLLDQVKSEQPHYFFLSAGGNDFLGNITRFLNVVNLPKTDDLFFNTLFKDKLISVKAAYLKLIRDVLEHHPEIEKIVLHGYDYPIPCYTRFSSVTGLWLGKPMLDYGLKDKNDHKRVVKFLIDTLEVTLKEVAKHPASKGKVRILNFKGMAGGAFNWFDEIHPKDHINKKFADKIISELLS